MKIGILTYHSVPNFGANLQALSTISFLKKKGLEPFVINWLPFAKELIYKNTVSEVQWETHQQFCSQYLPMTELCRNEDDIKNVIVKQNIEKLFIGSDALWNYTVLSNWKKLFRLLRYGNTLIPPDHNFPNPFWGSLYPLLNHIPMVAFSVSSQNMPFYKVKGRLKTKMGTSLMQFKHITVRDEWTKLLIEYLTNEQISPNITPDPVFAFNNNVPYSVSKEKILSKFTLPEKYILLSFRFPKIDNNWIKKFEYLLNKQGYACIGLSMPEGLISFDFKKNIHLPLDPLDWYYLIKYSSGYVGERMHPIVIALHNSVPFYSFDEYGGKVTTSSKTYDIIRRAELLENHFAYCTKQKLPEPCEVFRKLLNFDIDKCNSFSKKQFIDYEFMMNRII
jgi:hypothetical protein